MGAKKAENYRAIGPKQTVAFGERGAKVGHAIQSTKVGEDRIEGRIPEHRE
jgi:hypothetical protein